MNNNVKTGDVIFVGGCGTYVKCLNDPERRTLLWYVTGTKIREQVMVVIGKKSDLMTTWHVFGKQLCVLHGRE
jgi:hypothetical protein